MCFAGESTETPSVDSRLGGEQRERGCNSHYLVASGELYEGADDRRVQHSLPRSNPTPSAEIRLVETVSPLEPLKWNRIGKVGTVTSAMYIDISVRFSFSIFQ
jgi:hypothetical protein